MSKVSLALGVLVALSFYVHQAAAARMHAKKVTLEQQQGARVLSAQQLQFRKLTKAAEASLVCGNPHIKEAINADSSVDGVQDINWISIKKTAEDGLDSITKNIESLTLDIAELDQRVAELEEAGRWGELPDEAMDEMLHAACQTEDLKNDQGDCGRAREYGCGFNDPIFMEPPFRMPPYQEPIDAFRAMAEKKAR